MVFDILFGVYFLMICFGAWRLWATKYLNEGMNIIHEYNMKRIDNGDFANQLSYDDDMVSFNRFVFSFRNSVRSALTPGAAEKLGLN